MNVASLELSRELFEVSGWGGTHRCYRLMTAGDCKEWRCIDILPNVSGDVPAYDLGYLLRNLPDFVSIRKANTDSGIEYEAEDFDSDLSSGYCDTPEDAAAKLAIELFKQGVLTRGGDD